MPASLDVHITNGAGTWTILAAAGSLAASVVALAIAGWSERNRRRADRTAQLQQARKVFTLTGAAASGGVELVNASADPIFEVKLVEGDAESGEGEGQDHSRWRWVSGNGYGASYVAALLPNARYPFAGYWSEADSLLPPAHDPPNYMTGWLRAHVEWSDSRGDRWRREGNGEPRLTGTRSATRT